ncbi:MAG: zinc-binding dehydrogenase [Cypionkella sp.]
MDFATLNPKSVDVGKAVQGQTGSKGADVVFEVSGSQPGVDLMTTVAAIRGRFDMVAIHATMPQIDLFQFFWRELEMLGARVYEREGYDRALQLLADGVVDCGTFITDIQPLENIQSAFRALTQNPDAIKSMIQVSEVPA